MNILVMGGVGFIGSNFVCYMVEIYFSYSIVNYDLFIYVGNFENLKDIESYENYMFVKGDINNREFVDYLVKYYNIDVIVNFVVEFYVDCSIIELDIFIKSNVLGI